MRLIDKQKDKQREREREKQTERKKHGWLIGSMLWLVASINIWLLWVVASIDGYFYGWYTS